MDNNIPVKHYKLNPKRPKLSSQVIWILFLIFFFLFSNFLTYKTVEYVITLNHNKDRKLFLLDNAETYVRDVPAFESKVRKVSYKLGIPPEWLMAVMHSESRFNTAVRNFKGSGATGLIQWMPATAKHMNTTTEQLGKMSHVEQLDYVYKYLNEHRKYYRNYESLTDLYLAILYPKALKGDYCYTLYAQPSKRYKMNKGLDENKDGSVTVLDIDKRMKRLYRRAYDTDKLPTFFEKISELMSYGKK